MDCKIVWYLFDIYKIKTLPLNHSLNLALPNRTYKNAGCPVEYEFQMNNKNI